MYLSSNKLILLTENVVRHVIDIEIFPFACCSLISHVECDELRGKSLKTQVFTFECMLILGRNTNASQLTAYS